MIMALRPRPHWRRARAAEPPRVTGILRVPRRAALTAIAVLVAAASLTSFAESYRGLYDWAHEHGLSGVWAAVWPLQIDVFIAVGELALFVALVDAWERRSRGAAWAVTLTGLAVSVAGNVGHVTGHSLTNRATAAVPPLAAAAALAVGLGVLKRVVERHHQTASTVSPPSFTDAESAALAALIRTTEAGNPLSQNQLQAQFRLTRAEATKVRQAVLAGSPAGARALPHAPGPPAGVNGYQPAERR
jgi:hypothetical protein